MPLRFVPRVLGTLCLAAGMGLATSLLMPGNALAVNVNSATQEQLQTVRGIGPKTARVIIEERMRGGDYESFEDLADRVKGIGPKKTTSLRSEEHTSELQSLMRISYAVFCLKKKKKK